MSILSVAFSVFCYAFPPYGPTWLPGGIVVQPVLLHDFYVLMLISFL